MRKPGWVCLLCLASVMPVCAQTAQSAEDAFRDSLSHQQLVLKNFSADTKVHLKWVDSDLRCHPPYWHMLGVLTINSVHLKGEHLLMNATRRMLVPDKHDVLGPSGDAEKVELDIDLNGADPAVVLPEVKEKLFFASVDDAITAIPKDFRKSTPGSLKTVGQTGKKASKQPPLPVCDCAARDTDACVGHSPTDGWKNPQVLHVEDPHYTEQARNNRVNGSVRIAIGLDASGRINDLWVTTPLGSGLEQAAALAVRQYVFAPATCHDQPVPTSLYVDVDFQIY